ANSGRASTCAIRAASSSESFSQMGTESDSVRPGRAMRSKYPERACSQRQGAVASNEIRATWIPDARPIKLIIQQSQTIPFPEQASAAMRAIPIGQRVRTGLAAGAAAVA